MKELTNKSVNKLEICSNNEWNRYIREEQINSKNPPKLSELFKNKKEFIKIKWNRDD